MYATTRKSIVRFINNQIALLRLNGTSANLAYVDFDGHGDITSLPSSDVCGIHAFSLTDEDQFQTAIFGITVSTYDDTNFGVMVDIVDWFYNLLRIRMDIPLLDHVSGNQIGQIKCMLGTTAMPVERANTRAAVLIQVNGTVIPNPA